MDDKTKIEYLNEFKKSDVVSEMKFLTKILPDRLYKFYSLGQSKDNDDLKFETLEEDKIWVDLFKNQNDPFEMINLNINKATVTEKRDVRGNLIVTKEQMTDAYQKHMDHYKNVLKTASFVENMETNISMWAYYTNNHKGFCCSYEPISNDWFKMGSIKPVLYEKIPSQITASFVERLTIDGLNALIASEDEMKMRELYNWEFIKLLASCKDESWKHEQEYRVFYVGDDSGKGERVKCSQVNLKIKEIFVGISCSDSDKKELKRIADKLGVPFIEMKVSEDNYSLTK